MIRFIPFERYDPYEKIALNDILLDSVRNTNNPIIWLAGWDKTCINIGFGQKIDVVNTTLAKRHNIPIVRRQGGGGATVLTPYGEITWGIIAPSDFFPSSIDETYKFICQKIIDSLNQFGINSTYKPINDVVTEQGKISGSTLKKTGGVVYAAGTLLYEVDKSLMNELLFPEKDYLKKSVPEKNKAVVGIKNILSQSSPSFDEVIDTLKKTLLNSEEYVEKPILSSERELAKKGAKKFRKVDWIENGKLHN